MADRSRRQDERVDFGDRGVLVISGSTRSASTNTAFCRTAALCAPPGISVIVVDPAVLPHFNPDDDRDPLPPAVADLRAAVAAADAVLFCTPEYAGTLPGSMKNLLDWMVGGTELSDKPVAWVNVAPDPDRGRGARATLRTVLGYLQATVIDAACAHLPVTREMVGSHGSIRDPAARRAIAETLLAVLPPIGDGPV